MRPRYDFARSMARKLLRKHRVQQPPVPVEHMLFLEGVRVEVLDYPDGTAGESWWEGETPCLAVARALLPGRLRFTLAHEWGHLALFHHRHPEPGIEAVARRLREGNVLQVNLDPIEVEANAFAAELLLPEAFFRRDWTCTPEPRRLAARYEVSEAAVRWRALALRGLREVERSP